MSAGHAVHAALTQAWPPFVLVAGLLAIGAVADAEGVFGWAAHVIVRRGARPLRVLGGLLLLTAATSAVLNLDTAAAFLTPVLILAARGLGADEAPFVYGAVLMANAGSLFLLGSNLTNLLVLGDRLSGASFAAQMLPAAVVSVLVTAAGLLAWGSRRRGRSTGGAADLSPTVRLGPGAAAIIAAAALILVTRQPALPVAGVGLIAALMAIHRRTVAPEAVLRAVGPRSLAGLLLAAVLLGTLAREWSGPAQLLSSAGTFGTAAVAAIASVLVNNLPAATLLSAHRPAHPQALLIGLNLGPNLAVSGSLSALIWWRAARRLGAEVSVRRYTLLGAPLACLAGLAALAALRV